MEKRKVIGIGETILDILFKNGQPTAAVPGGSVFNGIISLGRMGVDVAFITETGNDRVGNIIKDFMRENGVCTDFVSSFPDGKSPVSLAFLNEHNDADYLFYKDYPNQRLDVAFPDIREDDIVMFGSYFALNPVLRSKVTEFLDYARERKAILYYDPNFRDTHRGEALKLAPTLIENLEYADIVRGAEQDFANRYGGLTDPDAIYRQKIQFYCPYFLLTAGNKGVSLRTPALSKQYEVKQLEAISTIGAGDNFNAGIVYALLKEGIGRRHLNTLGERDWDALVKSGIDFAADVCMSLENSVSKAFADQQKCR